MTSKLIKDPQFLLPQTRDWTPSCHPKQDNQMASLTPRMRCRHSLTLSLYTGQVDPLSLSPQTWDHGLFNHEVDSQSPNLSLQPANWTPRLYHQNRQPDFWSLDKTPSPQFLFPKTKTLNPKVIQEGIEGEVVPQFCPSPWKLLVSTSVRDLELVTSRQASGLSLSLPPPTPRPRLLTPCPRDLSLRSLGPRPLSPPNKSA